MERRDEFRDLLAKHSQSRIKDIKGEQMIRCPLPGHVDKKPSCSVDIDNAVWKCFGCGQGGGLVDLAEALRENLSKGERRRAETPKPKPEQPKPKKKSADLAVAAAQASVQADGTPGQAYLVARRVWPPSGAELPTSVRWCDAARLPLTLPPSAEGLLLFGMGKGFMQAHAITAEGERVSVEGKRWMRTLGGVKGRRFNATPDAGWRKVVLTEGPIDALAMRWIYPDARVFSICGTGNVEDAMITLPDSIEEIIIEFDGDNAGREAARKARRICARRGWRYTINWRADGDADPADQLAAMIGDDEAAWEKIMPDEIDEDILDGFPETSRDEELRKELEEMGYEFPEGV